MGYKDRVIRLDFPDLGDDVWVEIYNPKTLPEAKLFSRDAKTIDKVVDGVTESTLDPEDASLAYLELMASLVKDWHVYDGSKDDQPEIPMPAQPQHFKECLPPEIWRRIAEKHREATNPPKTPEESTTSS